MRKQTYSAFTLAEMMVVMLILSIVLAAMAPVMTTKMKSTNENSSPWRWAQNNQDAYFGTGPNQHALIGRNMNNAGDNGKLIIDTQGMNNASHIIFRNGNTLLGQLIFKSNNNIGIGLNNLVSNNGEQNIAIGNQALQRNTSGARNISIGSLSLSQNTTGRFNTAIGDNSMRFNTTGENNTAVGRWSLYGNRTGSNNVGIGYQTMTGDNVGDNNVGIGNRALLNNTEGNNNSSIGTGSLQNNTTGENNTAIGSQTLLKNTKGNNNTAIGTNSGPEGEGWTEYEYNEDGDIIATHNYYVDSTVSIGADAHANGSRAIAIGKNSSAFSDTIAIGYNTFKTGLQAKHDNVYANIGIGNEVMTSITEAKDNVGIGYQTMQKATTALNNVAVGYQAMQAVTEAKDNVAIGYQAMNKTTTAKENIAIGRETLFENDEAEGMIAIGNSALKSIKGKCGNNIAIGRGSISKATYSYGNLAVGEFTLENLQLINNQKQLSSYNVAIGQSAMRSATQAASNTAVGTDAMRAITTGYMNTAIGGNMIVVDFNTSGEDLYPTADRKRDKSEWQRAALGHTTTGHSNVAVGTGALWRNETGNNNTAIGVRACENVMGSNKTCIGHLSGPASGSTYASKDNTDKVVFLGDSDTTVYIPGNLIVNKDAVLGYCDNANRCESNYSVSVREVEGYHNLIRIGYAPGGDNTVYATNGDSFKVGNFQINTTSSDRRLKNVGERFVSGLDKIRQLKVFNYTFKNDKEKTPRVGVIAQDLQKIFPDAVTKGEDGFLRIRMEDMFYAVINAIKELDANITKLIQTVERIEKDNFQLKKENKELKARIEALEKKLK